MRVTISLLCTILGISLGMAFFMRAAENIPNEKECWICYTKYIIDPEEPRILFPFETKEAIRARCINNQEKTDYIIFRKKDHTFTESSSVERATLDLRNNKTTGRTVLHNHFNGNSDITSPNPQELFDKLSMKYARLMERQNEYIKYTHRHGNTPVSKLTAHELTIFTYTQNGITTYAYPTHYLIKKTSSIQSVASPFLETTQQQRQKIEVFKVIDHQAPALYKALYAKYSDQ